jgi:2',3'-cyclic-nucleotide 2'-phosphodiesterase (5'-nucleotidase family)
MAFGGTDLYGGPEHTLHFLEQVAYNSSDAASTGLPMISTNLDVSGNATWSNFFLPYHVHTTPGGVKVGFVSLLGKYFETTTTDLPAWFKINPDYSSYNYIRRAISSMRMEAGTDVKIVLIVEENRELTSVDELLEIEFVNIILVRRPQTITAGLRKNIYGMDVVVSTVGNSYGYDRYVAELDITIATNGDITVNADSDVALTQAVAGGASNPVWMLMNSTYNPLDDAEFTRVVATLPLDSSGAPMVVDGREGERAKSCVDRRNKKGYTPTTWGCRSGECPMGNLIVNALLHNCDNIGVDCDIAILNSGSIRNNFSSENLKVGDVNLVLPFSNVISSFDITGEQVMRMLANSIVDSHSARFLQSNIRFVYYPIYIREYEISETERLNVTCGYQGAFVGANTCTDTSIDNGVERIMDVQIKKNGVWTDIDTTQTYRIVTSTYLYEGGDCYTMLASTGDNAKDHGITLQDTLIQFLESVNGVSQLATLAQPAEQLQGQQHTSSVDPASVSVTTIPTSLIRTFAEYTSCLFDSTDAYVVPPIASSSQCLNAFIEKTESEYNRCPNDNDFCTSHVNSTFSEVFSNSQCDADVTECSGFGFCNQKKCECTLNVGTSDEIIEGVPTYGEFAGIQMISGTDCSELRSEWALVTGEQVAMYIAGIISVIVATFWMVLLFIHRNKPVIKASSPMFSLIMCFGAIVGSVSIFFDAQAATTDFCNASLSFILVGYVILFSAVFVKTHRIDHIFNSKLLKNKTKYTDLRVLVNICVFVVIELIILGLFRALSPLEPRASALTDSYQYAMLCASDSTVFTAVLFVYNGMLMVWGVYLAVRTRNVDSNFNESKHIGGAIYNCAFSCLIMILVMYVIVSTNPTIAYLIKAWLVAYIIVCTLTIMFLPRFRLLAAGSDGRMDVTTDRSVVGDLEKQAQRDKRTIQFLVQKMKERDMFVLERDEAITSLQTYIRAQKLTPPEIKVTAVEINPPPPSNGSGSEVNNAPSQPMTPSGAPKKPLFANRMSIGHRNSVLGSAPRLPTLATTPSNGSGGIPSTNSASANSNTPLNPAAAPSVTVSNSAATASARVPKLNTSSSSSGATHITYEAVPATEPSSGPASPTGKKPAGGPGNSVELSQM